MKRDCKPEPVVIEGIVSSTLLTLSVLPTLYTWFEAAPPRSREPQAAEECP